MKKIFILLASIAFGLKLNSMQEPSATSTSIDDLPQEVRSHILSFIKADSLENLFKEIARVAGTNTEMRNLAHDPVLIKNLIYRYFQEQLKTKSLEEMVSQIEDAKKFIQHQVIKDRNTNLLQAINTAFNSVVQNLSKKHLNLENKSSEEIAKEFFDAMTINLMFGKHFKITESGEFLFVAGSRARANQVLNKVKIFLYAGVNPNIQSNPKLAGGEAEFIHFLGPTTALIFAIALNKKKLAEALLNAGADPNAKDPQEITPLIEAINAGNIKLVKLLLKFGAEPDIQALTLAKREAEISRSEDIVNLLISKLKDKPLEHYKQNNN